MKFKLTLEPFVVEYVHVVIVIEQIMKSMSFQTDKSLRYDPKKVIHQRKLDVNLSGYEAEQNEVLATLANTDFLEQMGDDDNNSSSSDRINPDKAQSVINFLKLSSDEALQAFKVNDRYQTIMPVKRVINKDELIKKVHNRT